MKRSFRKTLTLTFVGSVAMTGIVVSLVLLLVTAARLSSRIVEENRQLLRTTELQIDSYVEAGERTVLEVLALARLVAPARLGETLERILEINTTFEALAIAARDGRVIAAAPIDSSMHGHDLSRHPAFHGAGAVPLAVPRVTVSQVTGAPTISVSVASEDLVVIGNLSMEAFAGLIVSAQLQTENTILVTDSVGVYAAHPDPAAVARRQRDEVILEMREGSLPRPYTGTRTMEGERALTIASLVSEGSWGVVIFQPVGNVFAPVNDLILVVVVIVLVGLVLIEILAGYWAARLYRPVKVLVEHANAVEAGAYAALTGDVRYEEFSELGSAIDRMIAAVQEREVQLASARRAAEDELAMRREADQTLRAVVRGTVGRSGQDLFDHLVRVVLEWLDVDLVAVHSLDAEGRFTTIAVAGRRELLPELPGSTERGPCGEAISTGTMVHIAQGLSERFPAFIPAAPGALEGYVGMPLREPDGEAIVGVICALSTAPLDLPHHAHDVFEILAVHAAGELRRRAVVEELNRARDEAIAANDAKSAFLANMSHEVRTPLNGIQGMARLIGEGRLSAGQREYLRLLRLSADNLLTILNDLLDFSAIEVGRLRVESVAVDVERLVRDTVEIFAGVAEEAGLALGVELDASLSGAAARPITVHTDPNRVQQILVNLISNAIKYTNEGSVAVRLALDANHAAVTIAVADTGIGIAPERKEDIFQSFLQIESSFTKKYRGIGLGLAISRQLAGLLEGSVRVESSPGIGSVFTLTLPLDPVIVDSAPSRAPAAGGGAIEGSAPAPLSTRTLSPDEGGRLAGVKILVAEDEAINRLYLTMVLRREGAIVVEAKDGVEAVDRALVGDMDVALLDISMPIRDGLEAARMIHEQMNAGLPCIALTAHAFARDQDAAREAGMVGFLSKPVDEALLLRTLREVLGTA